MKKQKIEQNDKVLKAYNRLTDAINFELLALDTTTDVLRLIGSLRTKLSEISEKFGGL